jgi:hypothetical protein
MGSRTRHKNYEAAMKEMNEANMSLDEQAYALRNAGYFDDVQLTMSPEAYEEYMEVCHKFENRQDENKFIKQLRELVSREDVSDKNFRKFVKNYIDAGGLD